MAQQKIVLYDIPSKDQGCTTWSFNVWRTRLALNYKGLDYETVWVEYPDIKSTISSLGVPPGDDVDTPFTLPVVRFPDGTAIMNSKYIAPELDKRYPSPTYPSIRFEDPATQRAFRLLGPIFQPLVAYVNVRVPRIVLNDASVEYFERTRAEELGMTIQEFEKTHGGERAWEKSVPAWKALDEALHETEGPFLTGSEPMHADFIIVGYVHFVQRIIPDTKPRFDAWPAIVRFHQACGEWFARDSH